MVARSASLVSRCSRRVAVTWATVLAMAVSIRPTAMAALIAENQPSTIPSMTWSPLPSSPSMAAAGTATSWALIGLEALPRRPRPSNGPATFRPAVSAGTSQMVLAPSAASGRLDQR
jgi:hypothetical protein